MKFPSVLTGAFGLFVVTASEAQVTLIDLSPPATNYSEGISINKHGVVLLRAAAPGQPIRGWLRQPDGTFIDVGLPPGVDRGSVNGINNLGYAVASVVVDGLTTVAVRSPEGTWTFPMPTTHAIPSAINDDGAIVGYEFISNRPSYVFMYEPGLGATHIPNVGPPEEVQLSATRPGINNDGLVFGKSGTGPNRFQAFRYTRSGGLFFLPSPGGQNSEAACANELGEIVGWAGLFGSSVGPVKWLPDGTVQELEGLSGFLWANGINNRGDAVGSGFLAGARAVLWSDDFGAIDLNVLLTPQQQVNWELRIAYQINDDRQIVGLGLFDPDGPSGPAPPAQRGFLLIIPEPAIGMLPLLALLVLRRNRAQTT